MEQLLKSPELVEVHTHKFGLINSRMLYSSPLDLCKAAYKSCERALRLSRYKSSDELAADLQTCQKTMSWRSTVSAVKKSKIISNSRTARNLFISFTHKLLSVKADLASLNAEWEQSSAHDKEALNCLADCDKQRKDYELLVVKRLQLFMACLLQDPRHHRLLKRRSAFYCFLRHLSSCRVTPKRTAFMALPDQIRNYFVWKADNRQLLAMEAIFSNAWRLAQVEWYEHPVFTSHQHQPVSDATLHDELRKAYPDLQVTETCY
jgi:hypothetical protein